MAETAASEASGEASRRDFLTILTAASGAVAGAAIAWPLIDALNPPAQSAAQAQMIVTVADIPANMAKTVFWDGLPILIRRLTPQQIADNQAVVPGSLPNPARFTDRVKPGYENFVVVVGLNTGLPCALEGNNPSEPRGDFDGWLSPCDGSVYDPLGRVRGGAARKNLTIPRFKFINAAQIQLG
jgi:ubiquinol-cytochrome c reductase iron-sulfur subunit